MGFHRTIASDQISLLPVVDASDGTSQFSSSSDELEFARKKFSCVRVRNVRVRVVSSGNSFHH